MNIDIETDHVAMRPAWREVIDAWVERCKRQHPEIRGVEVLLRRDGRESRVRVVADASGRKLWAAEEGMMDLALHDALEAIEGEILVHEAIRPRG